MTCAQAYKHHNLNLIGEGSRRTSYCDGWRGERGFRVRILPAGNKDGDSCGWSLYDGGVVFELKGYRCSGSGRRCGRWWW